MMNQNFFCPTCNRKYLDPPFLCIDCGTELGWKCTSCHHGNPLVYRRCGKCGITIPSVVAAMINEGKQLRIINIPQYTDTEINELLEEGERLTARRHVQTLTQDDLDKMFE
ncbi:MAG: hypothetical protein KBF97_03280 [Bacteroidetes bacterium]|nr:hypothetical protein [Bacteroidota bacterium]